MPTERAVLQQASFHAGARDDKSIVLIASISAANARGRERANDEGLGSRS